MVWLSIGLWHRLLDPWQGPSNVLLDVTTNYAECFVVGIIVFYIYKGRTSALTWALLAAALCLSLVGFAGELLVKAPLLLGLCGVAVGLAARGRLWMLELGPLPFLGRISYALYLIHIEAIRLVHPFAQAIGLDWWLEIAAQIFLALAVAAALTYLVERPANRALSKLGEKFRNRRVAQPTLGEAE